MVRWVGLKIQAGFRFVGIAVYPRRTGYHYVPDIYGHAAFKQIPLGTLPEFGALAAEVIRDRRSTLYYDRLHVIYQALAHVRAQFDPAEPLNSVEVGVYKGGTSYFIASASKHFGLSVTHHCFDTFEGHAAQDITSLVDTDHLPTMFSDTQYESVKEYLSGFGTVRVFKGRFQDTCGELQDKKIHFVHFDVDIYDPTLFGLQFFDSRLAPGGVIIVDDYGFTTCPGVKKAVDEFVAMTPGYFSMSLLTGQFLLVKLHN
ncbi:MAG: TylF/MycF family methyltransferase [Anaerolineae bacterium]|nr:TylF/MycF family methyltransferase [Anaerolineae bacterium]